ncbi:Peroxidase [Mycena chlorophos]|uniref:Peroxidase n=1 Tax=Mycena chlorophos TaxID=658473 RepID=A0A8H6W546_MYCCL|nr:Peroxidase [Mycena chlorophos]
MRSLEPKVGDNTKPSWCSPVPAAPTPMFSKSLVVLAALATVLASPLERRVTCAGGQTTSNEACCVLFPVLEDIQANLFGNDTCGDASHTALRVSFHDAIGFSMTNKSFGTGADGSIFLFGETELSYPANLGIADAFNLEAPFINGHPEISVADFIQFTAAVSLTKCPGVAQPTFMFGRVDAKAPAPIGTVPQPTDNIPVILARMGDAGLNAQETVALIASHSIAGADDIDPNLQGLPFDSTPSTFDTQFFVETQLRGTVFPGSAGNAGEVMAPIKGELRLLSDSNFARDSSTSCFFQANVNNQQLMANNFKAAFAKMQSLGQDVSKMVDCSDVLPPVIPLPGAQQAAFFPSGTDQEDVEQACATAAFPSLPVLPGPLETVASIFQDPATDGNCDDDGSGCVLSEFPTAAKRSSSEL